MKCARIEQLLPLHAGGDLEAELADIVDHHLTTCPRCLDEWKELAAAAHWLQSCPAPEHAPAVLTEVRLAILSRIDHQPSAHPNVAEWVKNIRGNRPLFALTLAATFILVVTIPGLRLYRRVNQTMPSPPATPTVIVWPPSADVRSEGGSRITHLASQHSHINTLERNRSHYSPPPVATSALVVSETELTESTTQLRIEMQTTDQNIRIIWFADNR